MKVHHLDCGTMSRGTMRTVCHVLLIEAPDGLVLVDTGFGLLDCIDPGRRLGLARWLLSPLLDPGQSAVRQVEKLGFRPNDVRHIITTHLDLDHVGGLADFPHAQVHATADEIRAQHAPATRRERYRYRKIQFAHGPQLVGHEPGGEAWRGFGMVRELRQIAAGIVLIFLPGHTRGHAAVAVDAGSRWVLHCGDAFFLHGTLDGVGPVPKILAAAEWLMAHERQAMRQNHERLAELYRRGDPELLLVNSHDPVLLDRARQAGK